MKLFLLTLSVALALVAGSPARLNRTSLLRQVTGIRCYIEEQWYFKITKIISILLICHR